MTNFNQIDSPKSVSEAAAAGVVPQGWADKANGQQPENYWLGKQGQITVDNFRAPTTSLSGLKDMSDALKQDPDVSPTTVRHNLELIRLAHAQAQHISQSPLFTDVGPRIAAEIYNSWWDYQVKLPENERKPDPRKTDR